MVSIIEFSITMDNKLIDNNNSNNKETNEETIY